MDLDKLKLSELLELLHDKLAAEGDDEDNPVLMLASHNGLMKGTEESLMALMALNIVRYPVLAKISRMALRYVQHDMPKNVRAKIQSLRPTYEIDNTRCHNSDAS